MTDMTKRSRFQIHLSTAIVLMVLAGMIAWQNLIERWALAGNYSQLYYGWPVGSFSTDVAIRNKGGVHHEFWSGIGPRPVGMYLIGSAVNCLIGLSSLVSAGILTEIAIALLKSGRRALSEASKVFQIRLITAVILVPIAGLLLAENIKVAALVVESPWKTNSGDELGWGHCIAQSGWPCQIVLANAGIQSPRKYMTNYGNGFRRDWAEKTIFSVPWEELGWWRQVFALNAVLNLSILVFVATTIENILRRRESRARLK